MRSSDSPSDKPGRLAQGAAKLAVSTYVVFVQYCSESTVLSISRRANAGTSDSHLRGHPSYGMEERRQRAEDSGPHLRDVLDAGNNTPYGARFFS